ncbi:hypothetical protein BC629DRAFT_902359 [Irpex lacteus]|nr:hypothetical protein BC629DRAFT_902359 [Irpex lacteus]
MEKLGPAAYRRFILISILPCIINASELCGTSKAPMSPRSISCLLSNPDSSIARNFVTFLFTQCLTYKDIFTCLRHCLPSLRLQASSLNRIALRGVLLSWTAPAAYFLRHDRKQSRRLMRPIVRSTGHITNMPTEGHDTQ